MLTAVEPQAARSFSSTASRASRTVLFLTSCVRGGGPGWSLFYLLKHLDRSRVEPVVVLPAAGVLAGRLDEIQVRYHIIPHLPERLYTLRVAGAGRLQKPISALWNAFDGVRAFVALMRFIRSERVDAIYCNNMLVKPIGAFAGQLTGTPIVFHCRNIHQSFVRRRLFVQLARLPAVKRVVCISNATERAYRFSGKTVVIPNGVDLDEYHPEKVDGRLRAELGLDEDTFVVGYVGRIVPWKGVDVLLDAARLVLQSDRRAVFCLIGSNPVGATRDIRSAYEQQAAAYGIADRVSFLGFREDIRPYVRDFDLLVLPSKEPEPFGRVNIEAMAMGVPVIATAHGGPREIIDDGVDGVLVPPNDAAALARAILAMMASPDLQKQLGGRGRQKVHQRFDARGVARRIGEIIWTTAR
ncbi:MAG: glycosyltransferase [Candidatus Latescibacteria bacterium]|nr:glycosyltransferase [Candidatus Latescibacterota bacterium]